MSMANATLRLQPTNIVDCDLDKVRIDQPVKVVFKPSENGQPVPMFTPA